MGGGGGLGGALEAGVCAAWRGHQSRALKVLEEQGPAIPPTPHHGCTCEWDRPSQLPH